MAEQEIYRDNALSADRLDERRDSATRVYGSFCCVIAATAATLTFDSTGQAFLAAPLWVVLIVAALSWDRTVGSLTSKLSAKSAELKEMERRGLVPYPFLTNEYTRWVAIESVPLRLTVRIIPMTFAVAGAVGAVRCGFGLFP